jgi:release factor glutamine methyltransferase
VARIGRRTSVSVVGASQTVGALVEEIARRIASVEDPKREARDVVAALLDVPRHWPLLHENKWVESETWQRASVAADKRAAGAPLAYAVGRANFRNLTLDVDERVLIPRPETELLVDIVLEQCKPGGIAIDVGTGSGAIAIALATEGNFDRVIATDISIDALDVARANARRHGAGHIEFVHGSLLKPIGDSSSGQVRAIVSNPPYVSFAEIAELPATVRDWEPMVALLSGRDGLAVTAQLVRQAAARLERGGLLALEVEARRASLVVELVSSETR